jgi:hypothetical protein
VSLFLDLVQPMSSTRFHPSMSSAGEEISTSSSRFKRLRLTPLSGGHEPMGLTAHEDPVSALAGEPEEGPDLDRAPP